MRAPALDRSFTAKLFHRFHRAIERHPGHQLRVREMPARPAHFPDAFIRLAPRRFEEFHDGALQLPRIRVFFDPGAARLVHRVDQLAINIELKLAGRRVTDTHRR